MIRRHNRAMTGRLVRPLRPPDEGGEAGPRPARVPVLRAPNDWMDAAACARPEVSGLPWTADRDQVEVADTEAMEAVCASCPVRVRCGRFLRPAGVSGGFWAGAHRDRPASARVPVTRLPASRLTTAG
jgi:hypothetical protein